MKSIIFCLLVTFACLQTEAANLPAPTLSVPSYGQTGVSTAPTYSWSAVTGVISPGYYLAVATSIATLPTDPAAFSGPGCVIFEAANSTSDTPSTVLNAGTTYYWQVRGRGPGSTNGTWSTTSHFTTTAAVTRLSAPTLSAPANAATGVSTTTSFSWSQVSGNQGYRIVVSTSASDLPTDPTQSGGTPANGFNQIIGQNTTSYPGTGTLIAGTTYYWEVHALATTLPQAGYWSSQNHFSTTCTLPGFPSSPSPANGATVSLQPATLSWSGASYATSYDVYLDGTFMGNVPISQYTFNMSIFSGYHGWYVIAKNSCGQSLGPPVVWSFTISPPPTVTVTSPNGGENWQVGSSHNITASVNGSITGWQLEYSTDGGSSWNWITGMSTPNTTINVSWTVPNAPSTTCKVRATVLYANGSVADVSDANFTISQPIPTVTVTSPNGGENWQVGSSHNITATSSGSITSVEIDYSTDGGSSWAYITGYSPLNNTINVSWTVPNTPSTTAKVKVIVGYSGGNVADVSDANFTISPPPALVISSVTPSAIQTKDWGQVVVYTVTVTDSIGNPVNGAVVGGDDNVQMVPYTTSPNTTDASGQITYFTSVPSGKADGTYNITFVATRSAYNTSSTVTRQVQIQHIPTSFGGTVTNSSTGNPISGATVTWGSSYSTTTAANGGYSFNNIVCGTATLTVSANGYQTYSQSYTPTCNTINLKSISLVPGLSGIVAGSNTVANQTTPVFIQLFPNPGHIDPTKQTWIVIHGRNSSSINTSGANIVRLAQDILAQRPNDQVLVLDWSAAAQDDNPSIYYPLDITPFTHDDWIEPIAQWAATALTGYGFSGLSLNLVGHSWGGNMTDEIAKRITGGVNTIVALDPAKNGIFGYHGAYNPDSNFGSQSAQINFARDSQYSWAFHSSFEGSEYTSTSADEAFVVNTGLNQVDPPDAHNASVNLFSYMLEHSTDNTDSVSPLFQLQRLLAHTAGPWLPDQRNTLPFIATLPLAWGAVTVTLIEDNIPGYEGIITTMVDLQNPKPALFDYVPTSPQITLLGNGISIADGDTTPSTTDGTDFGSVTQGQTGPTHTFTVRNDGGSTLTLGSVSVPIGFILDVGLPTSLAHGVSGTFTVRLATTSAGTKNGQVSFSNNDPNQNPFNFSIPGTVTTPVDTTPPALTINSPANGAVVTSASLPVNGTASDSGLGNNGISSVTVNGANATGGTTSGSGTASWNATVTLVSGVNTITVVVKDTLNNSTQKVVSVTYNPSTTSLVLTSPTPGSTLTSASVTFQWSSGMGVTNYFLFVGSSLGAGDIYVQDQGLNTSATVNGLPQNGSKLYVRFWWATAAAGWTFTDYTYTAPTSAPLLGISKPGTSMVFSWPTNATGYTLQSSPNLGSAAVWSTVSPSPVVVGGQNVVTNPMSGSRMFYRLMHP